MRPILENASIIIPDLVSSAGFFNRRKAITVVGHAVPTMQIKAPSVDTLRSDLSDGNQRKVVPAGASMPILAVIFAEYQRNRN